ncbi:hypothetical protein EVAR_79307_1 [Eumeta japonica]|uniref:Uncharacterized protein n=1 Tax=Eumeta variegata TaxID=151549 RepID=A0A4C1TFI2_EUMVA|nr:hypothetical protein EVAR_79307_1 [Eumeta japonica]
MSSRKEYLFFQAPLKRKRKVRVLAQVGSFHRGNARVLAVVAMNNKCNMYKASEQNSRCLPADEDTGGPRLTSYTVSCASGGELSRWSPTAALQYRGRAACAHPRSPSKRSSISRSILLNGILMTKIAKDFCQ